LNQVVIQTEHSKESITDEALMLAYGKGQASAFDSLYQKHKQLVFRFFFKQGLSLAIAEELCHDTWLKLINAREKYQPQALFRTYLFTIARNTLLDHYKKKSTQNEVNYANNDTDNDSSNSEINSESSAENNQNKLAEKISTPSLCEQQQKEQLHRALSLNIAALPIEQREVFLLKQESGFSLEQIAQITAQHQEKVKSSWRYALQRLRKGLQDYVK
jgi:RNA polymerase sigma-70 factor (ECF subfamily)